MSQLTASELARALNVTRTRVGQYVHEGKLAGCYTGEGRARRFDLNKVATALGRQLHPGQMLGNGAETKRALASLKTDLPKPLDASAPRQIQLPVHSMDGAPEELRDNDRYDTARTHKAEEEVRKLRRANAEAEGLYVLRSEVERQVARVIAQEIAEVEAMLRDGARRVADALGVDFKTVRKIFVDQWRAHRQSRASALAAEAGSVEPTEAELEADI